MKIKFAGFSLVLCLLLAGCLSFGQHEEEEPVVEAPEPDDSQANKLIRQGKIDEAKELFLTKIDINAADGAGNTALHVAAEKDESELISFLVLRGARIDEKNKAGDTPLHVAVKRNCQNAAAALVAMDAGLFIKDATGRMPIEIGLSANPAFYDILITERCASIRAVNGQSVVHYFVLTKDERAIDVCIRKQIPLSVIDNSGKSPLALCYEDIDDPRNTRIAAKLIRADAAPVRGEFAYFEDAVRTRNPSIRYEDGQTPLHMAAIFGRKSIADYLIEADASLKAQDVSGSTPLHEAVRYGRLDIAAGMLAVGADVNARDYMGKTPLLLVVPRECRNEMLALLIEKGADAQAKDMFGDTAFHVASMTGSDVPLLEVLYAAGAQVNERNKQGVTPIAIASEHNLPEHIRFYASKGADIHSADKDGNTPLTWALEAGRMEALRELVNADNVNTCDSAGNSPLHLAVLRDADMEAVSYLIEQGADINAQNKQGDSVLCLAVKKERGDVGRMLLERGADIFAANASDFSPLRYALTSSGDSRNWIISPMTVGAADPSGNTALHFASEWNLPSAASTLISRGANVNAANARGETALFNAVKSNSVEIVRILASKGAYADAKNYLGNTATHVAVQWNRPEALRALVDARADTDMKNISGKTPFGDAIRSKKANLADILLANGADINSTDATGRSALTDAVQSERADMVSYLLKRGANPRVQDLYGRNSLHEAVETGNQSLVSALVYVGCDPLSRDAHGKTPFELSLQKDRAVLDALIAGRGSLLDSDGNNPLHLAVRAGCPLDTMGYLISKGFQSDQRNNMGLTPLLAAMLDGKDDMAMLLIRSGANPFVNDNEGRSAVAIAARSHKPDILKEMISQNSRRTDIQGNGYLHIAAQYASAGDVRLLMGLGLDRSQRNVSGETPADVAVRWNRSDIVELLR